MNIFFFKPTFLIVSAMTVLMAMTSCSKDDDKTEMPVYHQSYVQGDLNDVKISMDDKNALISSEKSSYSFTVREKGSFPPIFDWKVQLIDTPDSTVTMYLHLDDLITRNNTYIYSPNSTYHGVTIDRCRIVVKNLKKGTEDVYHPKDKFGVWVNWTAFLVTRDGRTEKQNGITLEYQNSYTWPGIVGTLHGRLTNDEKPGHDIIIKHMDFKLY